MFNLENERDKMYMYIVLFNVFTESDAAISWSNCSNIKDG